MLSSSIMPRTTINLEGPLLAELKRLQKLEGKSLGQLVSELVAQGLASRTAPPRVVRAWNTRAMGAPLVNLADKTALYEALDQD